MKKYTYYFAYGKVDHEYDDYWDDEDNWGIALAYSAESINVIALDKPIDEDDFNEMVTMCVNNIIKGKSNVFDYDGMNLENITQYDIDYYYDDIIYEMLELFDVEILLGTIPLIWGDDCWDWDENYDKDNPPTLWRMII